MDSLASYRISVPGSTQVPDGRCSVFAYGAVTLFGRLSHTILLTGHFVTSMCQALQPRASKLGGLGCSHFARHYSGNDLFSSGYLDVSVLQVPLTSLCVRLVMSEDRSDRFPHSEIPGSKLVHSSPRLIAVTRVLHRHLTPRHPP